MTSAARSSKADDIPLSPSSSAAEVLAYLRSIGSEESRQGMLRYGIRIDRALGISHGDQRLVARRIRRNHERAFDLWASGFTEAQFIASLTADPARFSADDARRWAASFDSWDIVDGVSDLFVDTAHWKELITEFAEDDREFVPARGVARAAPMDGERCDGHHAATGRRDSRGAPSRSSRSWFRRHASCVSGKSSR